MSAAANSELVCDVRSCSRRRLAVLGLFSAIALISHVLLPLNTAVERVASPSAQQIQQSLAFVPARMAHYHVPGLSIACLHNGAMDWTRAFGVATVGGESVTPETLFQAGSISKSVTALAVLRLVERGKLNLDADVSQYLMSWKLPSNRFTEQKKVTLRKLLSHTAGVTVHGFGGYAAGQAVPTLVQVLNGEKPANSPPVNIDFVPGTKFRYAGGGYAIIQQILIDVTGEPFPDLMQELILQPLRMTHSTFQQPIPEKLRSLEAMPYDENGNAIEGGPHTYPEMAVGGLWTTSSDLTLFTSAIQDAFWGKLGAIVSASTAREMLRPVAHDYALGFLVDGNGPNRYFWHPGVNAGFVAFFFAYEKGDGLALMTNGQNTKALGLEIIHALAKQYGWTEYPTNSSGFNSPWMIAVFCASVFLTMYLFLRVIGHRKKRNEQPVSFHS
ncbi:MAG TPA: serine hydrolase domain-containing protein [Terriglobales bacterium]|nr:serine hydrolase domain-containing protein [Terriglobales bacterium]